MKWCTERLSPAFEGLYGKCIIIIIDLDNVSYHHGCDHEVEGPDTN